MKLVKYGFLLLTGCLPSLSALALSPLPPEPEGHLPWFYEAMDGDNWKNNDGWMDPDVDPCDWYGVTCGTDPEWGYRIVSSLSLPKNNLSGMLNDTGVLRWVRHGLDLSDNNIEGQLELLPVHMYELDLSRNHLTGPLPERPLSAEGKPPQLSVLDLSGNLFRDEVPGSWRELELLHLDLSNNRLDGGPEAAFQAIHREADSGYLSLADNRFSGPLPNSVIGTGLLPHNKGTHGGGVNLCWNEFLFTVPFLPGDEPIIAWLKEHHVGGENFGDCAWRERVPIDPTVSGTWYDPSRSGEGAVLHLLEDGRPLLYWFTFDEDGGQRWLTEVGTPGESHFRWSRLYETRGDFSRGFSATHPEPLQVRGGFRFDRTGADTAHVERVYYDPNQEIACLAVHPPPAGCFLDSHSDRLEHIRLTRLAGTTCDNQHGEQWMSGVWRSRDASGEGFILEVLEDGRVVVYWFTYTPDGSGRQAWVTGVGGIAGNTVTAAVVQPLGGSFGGNFNRDAVRRKAWGEVTLEFNESRDAGQASWVSNIEEYGSGSYAVERLARPMMAACEK